MAQIKIKKEHSIGREEAKIRLKPNISAAGQSLGLQMKWNGFICTFEGPAKGKLEISDNRVEVKAELGFAARFFKSQIQEKLSAEMDNALSV